MPEVPVTTPEALTDRASVPPARSDDTQLAQVPERPTTPATEIVHHISADLDALPELPRTRSTSETSFTPELRRRRRLLYTAITAGLSLIIITSIYQIQSLGSEEPEDPISTAPVLPVPPKPTELVPAPSTGPASSLEELDRGAKTRGLLSLDLEEIFVDGSRRLSKVEDDAIAANAVTIVNLWATWCQPCKDELPGFADLFKRSNWGDDVRFTPILIDDKDPVWAHIKFVELMPTGARFFVDPLQGPVVGALRASKLLEANSGLPVTLVFDCRRMVRVVYGNRLTNADFVKLEGIVGALRKELKEPYCKAKPRRAAPTPPTPPTLPEPLFVKKHQRAPRCGDGNCDPGETIADCCDCRPPCTGNRRCESPDGAPICVDTVLGLKD